MTNIMTNGYFSRIKESRVIHNAGWLIGGNIAYKLIAFLIGLWTARYLGPGNQGLITYASAYTTFFFSIATLGINSVLVKKIIDNPDREGAVLGTALVLQSIASLSSVGVILGITYIVDRGEHLTVAVVFVSSFGLFFQVLGSIKYWFQAKLASKYATIATITAHIVSSLYKVILLILGKDILWFAFALLIDHLCVAIVLFGAYKVKNGPELEFSCSMANDLLSNSRYYILSGLMISIYGATDKLMLKQLLGEEAVGYYGTAITICTVWVFVLSAIIESMSPIIMEEHKRDVRQYRKKNVQLYAIVFYLAMFVSVGVTLFAEFGVQLLYGKDYMGAVNPLRILTWYVAFSYLGVARDIWVVCEGHQRHLPIIYVGAALINVGMNLWLIPRWGASGAAFASLLTQISTLFVVPIFIIDFRPNVKMLTDAILLKNIK